MAELFSAEWMARFKDAWNNQPQLAAELQKIGFNSNIGYGYPSDDAPRGVLVVENGFAVTGEAYAGQTLNWDMRAKEGDWKQWLTKPPGMMGLGMAYATGKLKFKVGDYAAMIKDPRMAPPFIASFQAMGRV